MVGSVKVTNSSTIIYMSGTEFDNRKVPVTGRESVINIDFSKAIADQKTYEKPSFEQEIS